MINIPKADRDRFIFCVSNRVDPSAPDNVTRSEPAKSTKCIFPNRNSDTGSFSGVRVDDEVDRMRLSTCSVKIA